MCSIIQKMVALGNPIKGLPSNAAFHPTIQTVGFQSANFCKNIVKVTPLIIMSFQLLMSDFFIFLSIGFAYIMNNYTVLKE